MSALAQVIEALLRPRALLEHRAPFRARQAVDDEPQRLAGRVRVDRLDAMNHCDKDYNDSSSNRCLIGV